MSLTQEQLKEIQSVADEHFDGDLRLGVAAHVHGVGVVKKVGSRVVDWMKKSVITKMHNEVIAALGKQPAAAPAKKKAGKTNE